jgi:mannose-1-phosphate guanylyltransferase/mannose-6-phosphate isomerase
MNLYPVIMCGGSGTRLWPASRPSRPKQFIPLTGERSLFEETVLRLQGLEGVRRLIVVAGAAHADAIDAQLAVLGSGAVVLLEPEARDSAPAMAAAGAWIAAHDPQGVAVVVASDHHIPDAEAFRAAVGIAAAEAAQGRIVTLGVRPTEPTSAYGYIRPALGAAPGGVARVEAFVEKPDRATAERYLGEGYLWNSGNFIVSASTLLAELDRHAPEVSACAREGVAQARSSGAGLHLGEPFRLAPKISIDYALMEKTDRASVLPVDLAWSDLGAWDAVKAVLPADADANAVIGEAVLLDSRNCLIRAEPGVFVAAVGVEGLAIIAERDAVLVCRIDKAQPVKAVTEALKAGRRPQADVPAAPVTSLADEARRLRRWLFGAALPLWWTIGADHEGWGFQEKLDLDGRPVDEPRRARVQTRQAYVYAMAGALGWPGPWRRAAEHGLNGFVARYLRPDGLYRTLVAPGGEALDETAMLYDQAFALLALATGRTVRPSADAEALALLDAIEAHLRHPAGGFREAGDRPFQSNPHMHLFEACLAWLEAKEADHGARARFEAVAAEIAELALTRFIDPEGGFLREFFAADWTPAPGEAGRIVEPGHQFEWTWLLERWARRTGDARTSAAARRLYTIGRRGIDPVRGVAIDQLNPDLSVRSASARLWPQTERLKAALILGDEPQAKAAAAGLWKYLDVETPGVWRDKHRPDGTFVDEPAPASSLYHIVAAIAELERVAGG